METHPTANVFRTLEQNPVTLNCLSTSLDFHEHRQSFSLYKENKNIHAIAYTHLVSPRQYSIYHHTTHSLTVYIRLKHCPDSWIKSQNIMQDDTVDCFLLFFNFSFFSDFFIFLSVVLLLASLLYYSSCTSDKHSFESRQSRPQIPN